MVPLPVKPPCGHLYAPCGHLYPFRKAGQEAPGGQLFDLGFQGHIGKLSGGRVFLGTPWWVVLGAGGRWPCGGAAATFCSEARVMRTPPPHHAHFLCSSLWRVEISHLLQGAGWGHLSLEALPDALRIPILALPACATVVLTFTPPQFCHQEETVGP